MNGGEVPFEWQREGARWVRTFRFSGYSEAVRFATEVAHVAETEGVSPLIHVGYRTTHIEVAANPAGARFARGVETIRLDEDEEDDEAPQ